MHQSEQPNSEERLKQAKAKFEQAQAAFQQSIAEVSQAFLGSALDDTVLPEVLEQPPKPFRQP